MLAEAAHTTGGLFDHRRFQARYGDVSLWRSGSWYEQAPTRLWLFFHPRRRDRIDPYPRIRSDLMALLAVLASNPEELSVPVSDTPTVKDSKRKEPASGRRRRSAERKRALEQRDTERAAQREMIATLNLVERGAIQVGPKTGVASATSMGTIIKALDERDWYDWRSKERQNEKEVGPIKGFAWPLLLQNAKLAEVHGSKLALTTKGRKALGSGGRQPRVWMNSTGWNL